MSTRDPPILSIRIFDFQMGVAKVEFDSIELPYLSEGFMRDEMHFLHVDVYFSTLSCPHPALVLTYLPIPRSVSAAG